MSRRHPLSVARLRRRVWRAWYRARWVLVDRRAMRRIRLRRVAGIDVVVLPGVLDPALFFSSEVLVAGIRSLTTPGASVLDLGTGSGIGALAAAAAGAGRVVATDIDSEAVRCARANVALHGLERVVELRTSDLFAAVAGQRFDVVAFNPPYQRGAHTGRLDTALRATPDLGQRFARALGDHLTAGGHAVVVLSTNGDPDAFLRPLRQTGFATDVIATRDRGSEVLSAWRVQAATPEARTGTPVSRTGRCGSQVRRAPRIPRSAADHF